MHAWGHAIGELANACVVYFFVEKVFFILVYTCGEGGGGLYFQVWILWDHDMGIGGQCMIK